MISCVHDFAITQQHTYVCTECGIEEPFLVPNTSDFQRQRLVCPYSRTVRFRELLEKLVGMSNGPPVKDPIWQHLSKGAPYQTPQDITRAVKLSGLKSKHYAELHVFCKCFLKDYKAPSIDPHTVCRCLRADFENVLFRWYRRNRQRSPTFFSYNWVLEKLLLARGITEFDIYLKRLLCPTRRAMYALMWKETEPTVALEHSRPVQRDMPLTLLDIV